MKTKRIISLLLCLLMMALFAGCESKEDREAGVKATADGFLSALCKLDVPTAAGFTVEGDGFIEEATGIDKEKLIEAISSELGESMAAYKDKFQLLFESLVDSVSASFDYEISGIVENGEKYNVSGTLTHIDFSDDFSELMSMDDGLAEQFATEILNELSESGKYTAETSEDELMNLFVESMINKLIPIVESKISEIDKITEEITIVVERPEDTWLVNYSESNLNDFVSELEE